MKGSCTIRTTDSGLSSEMSLRCTVTQGEVNISTTCFFGFEDGLEHPSFREGTSFTEGPFTQQAGGKPGGFELPSLSLLSKTSRKNRSSSTVCIYQEQGITVPPFSVSNSTITQLYYART